MDEKNKHLKPVLLYFAKTVEFHANLQLQMSGVKLSPLLFWWVYAVIGVYLVPLSLLLWSFKPDLNFRINKTVRTEEKSKRRQDTLIIPDVVWRPAVVVHPGSAGRKRHKWASRGRAGAQQREGSRGHGAVPSVWCWLKYKYLVPICWNLLLGLLNSVKIRLKIN